MTHLQLLERQYDDAKAKHDTTNMFLLLCEIARELNTKLTKEQVH